jgi:hypothetical protein
MKRRSEEIAWVERDMLWAEVVTPHARPFTVIVSFQHFLTPFEILFNNIVAVSVQTGYREWRR